MKRLLKTGAVIAVLALSAVMVGAAVTSAQGGEGPIGGFLTNLAERLGISEDELKTAIKDAGVETVDEAVAAGNLTQEQADRLKERIEEGGLPFMFGERHRGVGGAIALHRAAADILGVTPAKLMEELRDGASLAEVAEAHGKSVDDFKTELLAAVKTQLDTLVTDGRLTQDQADQLYQRLEENIDTIVNAERRMGPCDGMRLGPGGFGGEWGGPPADLPEDTLSDGTAGSADTSGGTA